MGGLGLGDRGSYFDSIDSAISSYSGSSISNLETAVHYSAPQSQPMMMESAISLNSQPSSGTRQKYILDFGYALKGLVDKTYSSMYAGHKNQSHHHFSPDPFLKSNRPAAQFIGKIEDIKEHIEEAFIATTGHELQKDIIFRVLPKEDFKKAHSEFGGTWSEGIQGFSINRKGFSQSLIFLKETELDKMLITAGHEIGHVLSFPLARQLNEEAKAFAFEMAWIKRLHENNIANLQQSINLAPNPAKNGLHDKAFAFVKTILDSGKEAMDTFAELVNGSLIIPEGEIYV